MTGGYHIINATGTVIKVNDIGYSDYIIFAGTMKDIIDAIKNNKVIVMEGQKTKRTDGTDNGDTGAWVLNFVHHLTESVDFYEAVVKDGGAQITITLDWEESEFTYAVSAA